MKKSTHIALTVAIAGLAVPVMADYEIGDTWSRGFEWTPGTASGSTGNNPSPDFAGAPVWQYSYANGGALDSSDPWFANASELMVWDSSWFAAGFSTWAKGDDVGPLIDDEWLIHLPKTIGGNINDVPVVSWANPVGDGTQINIEGSLTVQWDNSFDMGHPNDVDVVIALQDVSAETVTPLFATTVSKPTPEITPEESLEIDVFLDNIVVDEGDSILISHRGQDVTEMGLLLMGDDLTITYVPAPGAAVLGLAGLAGLARRRR